MSRLPTPGGDDGSWGNILNDFLSVSINTDGTLKSDTVGDTQLSAGSGTNGQVLTKDSGQTSGVAWSTLSGGASPATTSSLGTVQLAGDLNGTATAPTVPGLANKADKTTTITAGTGLTGGGDLSANRTLTVAYGSGAGTAAQGNDSRITGAEQTANKGAANGYAGLNGSTVVPTAQLGSGSASSSTFLRGDNTWTTPPTGSTTLAGDTDVAIASPSGGDVLTYNNLSGKWVNLAAPVISVNTHTGAVSLTKSDIGLSNVDNTSDANKPVSSATQTALNGKAATATTVSAGTGLTGGGDLSANRTISANFGNSAGTIAQGNDSRITGAEQTANKDQANGYAGLNGSSKVAFAELPTGATGSTVAVGNHTHTLTFSLTSFYKSGVLSTATGTQLLPVDGTYTIVGTRLTAGVAPTGAAILVDVNKNGTTIYTTQANRPTIAASAQTGGPGAAPDVTALSAGDYLSVDIDQVGSGTAGSDLTVSVIVSKTVQ